MGSGVLLPVHPGSFLLAITYRGYRLDSPTGIRYKDFLPIAVRRNIISGKRGLSKVCAAILVGGLGTRLRSAVADQPKVLARVHDRPFLAFLLDRLIGAGIESAVLCAGYKGDEIRNMIGPSWGPLRLDYSQEPSPLGTGGALRRAADFLTSDPVLVLNGDSYCEANLNAFYAWHSEKKSEVSLLLVRVEDTSRFGRVSLDARGRVTGFCEKGPEGGPGWINGGIYLLSRDLIRSIPPDRPVSLEREMFPSWIGGPFYGYESGGRFLDIGTPEDYAEAETFLRPEQETP
jgi:NDP-sugar pyrophosphorylase family protein